MTAGTTEREARPEPPYRLGRILLYPVKSARGVSVPTATVQPWGLLGDRRWAIVDADGQRLRARWVPSMMDITATPGPDGGLRLAAPAMPDIVVPAPDAAGARVPVDLYGVDSAVSGGGEADTWLSRVLQRPARLVWFDDPARRTMSPGHGGRPGDVLSLADAAPLLLTTTASLRRLDEWIAADARGRGEAPPPPLDMRRFRPNVVLDTDVPFAEETWSQVRIGGVRFRLAEHCDRCSRTLVHPETLERGKEPLRTLARYRRREGKTWFGIRVVPQTSGTLRVGDPAAAETG